MVHHRVNIVIEDQVAITTVEQAFRNHTDRQLEATYLFPIPKGASVNKFTMWVDGKEQAGELLDAKKATQVYTDIVRRTQDPGILEYIGNNLMRLKVFPVLPKTDQKVKISFTSVAPQDNGVVEYVYPLKTDGKSTRTLEEFAQLGPHQDEARMLVDKALQRTGVQHLAGRRVERGVQRPPRCLPFFGRRRQRQRAHLPLNASERPLPPVPPGRAEIDTGQVRQGQQGQHRIGREPQPFGPRVNAQRWLIRPQCPETGAQHRLQRRERRHHDRREIDALLFGARLALEAQREARQVQHTRIAWCVEDLVLQLQRMPRALQRGAGVMAHAAEFQGLPDPPGGGQRLLHQAQPARHFDHDAACHDVADLVAEGARVADLQPQRYRLVSGSRPTTPTRVPIAPDASRASQACKKCALTTSAR